MAAIGENIKKTRNKLGLTPNMYFTSTGVGKPLVLIHGMLVSGAMFDSLVPILSTQYQCIVPDLRGHGKNKDLPGPYTVKQFAIDLNNLLTNLKIEKVSLLGYSYGGFVAQQFAKDFPDKVNRLILVNTCAYNLATIREKIEAMLLFLLIKVLGVKVYAKLIGSVGSVDGLKLTREQVDTFQEMVLQNSNKPAMTAVVKSMLSFDSRSWLPAIRCPTIIIRGSEDTAIPARHAQMLKQGIEDSEFTEVAGAGHVLILTHTNQLAGMIKGFLA